MTKLNYRLITNIEVDGVDFKDAPDFADAFISAADYDGREMTEEELEQLNKNTSFVHQCVLEQF